GGVVDVLDCEGPGFGGEWRAFRLRVAASRRAGFPRDAGLRAEAARLAARWQPEE
ncbi:unnamed protein product, partial [Prorocentrum cordatum]